MGDGALTTEEQRILREELIRAFGPPPPTLLADIGWPPALNPPPDATPVNAWLQVIQQIAAGGQVDFPTLITEALRLFPRSQVLTQLRDRCALDEPPPENPNPHGIRPNVQAFVQTAGEDNRRTVMEKLSDLGPTIRFATNSTMLLEFATTDTNRVFNYLGPLPLEWTVVSPGEPAYLISRLIVEGPDGRRFRLGDMPATTQVQDLAASVLPEYPSTGASRRAVTDRILPNGQGERMRPDQTLHDADVRDGQRFRVGYETNAGAVNPTLRAEALTRARNQLVEFAEANDWGLAATAAEAATAYEVEFSRRSFGPPPPPSGPAVIDEHCVRIEFGPDFPQSAPSVYWLTPIFHPNIYPNYDCDEATAHPQLRGYVCLGELEEGYQPGLGLGDLCLMLLDIAGFGNYSLQVPTGDVVRTAGGLVVAGTGNALNATAAKWVRDNQGSLQLVDGRRLEQPAADQTRRPYRHLVRPLDG